MWELISRQAQICLNYLGARLSTLADNVLTSDEEPGDAAVEVTLDMLGAALTKNKESLDGESPDELGRAHSGIR
jgi:hypothetical protein